MEGSHVGVDVLQDVLNAAVLPDQVDGSLGADPLDGAAVVTTQQNAQVYELDTGRTGQFSLQHDPLDLFQAGRENRTCSLVRLMSCRMRPKWNSWTGSFLEQK